MKRRKINDAAIHLSVGMSSKPPKGDIQEKSIEKTPVSSEVYDCN